MRLDDGTERFLLLEEVGQPGVDRMLQRHARMVNVVGQITRRVLVVVIVLSLKFDI